MSLFQDLGMALFPQPEANEPPHTFRWRQTVAACIILLGGFQMVQGILSWGTLPFLFAGFASAASVSDLETQQRAIRSDQIVRNLNEAKERQCYAQREGNMAALQFATEALNKARDQYMRTTHQEPRIPACEELIVNKSG